MPVMDGPDATKAIRAMGYTGPIIGCTGNTLDMDLQRFKESGGEYVIGKPFELDLFHQFMLELKTNKGNNDAIATIPNSFSLSYHSNLVATV